MDGSTPGRPVSVNLDNLFVMLLTRARLGTPLYAMTYQVQSSYGATQRNILRARDCFGSTVGRRLFHLQAAAIVRANLPDDWPVRFSDTLLIGDGRPERIRKSGVFVIQRITWSPYKHDNIFIIVICTSALVFGAITVSRSFGAGISPDGLVQMRSRVYGGQSAEVTTIINESRLLECIRGKWPARATSSCCARSHAFCSDGLPGRRSQSGADPRIYV